MMADGIFAQSVGGGGGNGGGAYSGSPIGFSVSVGGSGSVGGAGGAVGVNNYALIETDGAASQSHLRSVGRRRRRQRRERRQLQCCGPAG